MTNEGPLTGVRVLDLSRLLPGPYCSRILADFGAEVVKVERPGEGDWARNMPPQDSETGESLLFRALNRGKKSLALNLKSAEGKAIFLRLAEAADVLLEGFRPGAMVRLGLGYETMSSANPRLVYCSLTGYGPSGPYRARAGHDLNYVGLAGLLDLTGQRDGPPSIPGVQVADLTGALWATIGILLALEARGRTGRGQHVDATLLGGALACLPVALSGLLGGQKVTRGTTPLTGGVVCYNVYETQDGKYMTLAALEPHFWTAFCTAVQRSHLLGQQFAPANIGEPAYDELCDLFRSKTRQEWEKALPDFDACCEPMLTLEEAIASAPVQALESVLGDSLSPTPRLSEFQTAPIAPAPEMGQDTDAILQALGYDGTQISDLRDRGVI